MKTIYIIIITTLFLTVACKEENLLLEQTPQTNEEVELTDAELKVLFQMRGQNNQVSMDEALQLANDVIGFLDGDAAVKSGTARKIGSVTAVRAPQTVALKSADGEDIALPDTAAYVFNFDGDAGFAIISGDTRVDASILGYAESGTLSDTIDNPGLMLFLEGAEEYIAQSIVEAEQLKDSLINDILAKLIADEGLPETKTTTTTIEDQGDYRITTYTTRDEWLTLPKRIAPLLPVQWRQGRPFNDNIRYRNCSNGTSPAGCVAVATAHIMAYWHHPSQFSYIKSWIPLQTETVTLDWNFLNSFTFRPNTYYNVTGKNSIITNNPNPTAQAFNTQAAQLMEAIGQRVGMSYNCSANGGSGASSSDAIIFLKALGYSAGGIQGYNYNVIETSLNEKKPVYISGYSRTHNHCVFGISWAVYNTTYEKGHTWVIDGFLQQRRGVRISGNVTRISTGNVITGIGSTTYEGETITYLHNNFGWGDSDNGYYVAGSFNADANPALVSDTKSESDFNFQYKIEICPFISYAN